VETGRERALVLHGGGSAANAWEIGVIAGLFNAGLDVTDADLIIGTSAGSTAAAQIGVNMMDLSTHPPAARAGYNQGRALAGQLTEFWR
jgi:Predicted esterase of the alpha-beta hydrolase superfamily